MTIKSNLSLALAKFGDDITIIKTSGNVSTKGKVSINRRFSQPWSVENLKQGIFSYTPTIAGGDILYHEIKDEYYFVYLRGQETLAGENIAQITTLLKTNRTCSIYRLSGSAGSMGGVKQIFTVQKTNIRCHLREISGDLRVEKPGLSEKADFLVYMQSTESLSVLDRLNINNKNYQVESIDSNTYPGIHEAQLSLDRRN